jgi:hypothetical protein
LPKSAQVEENRLIITQFDNRYDNGLYTCRATTNEGDYKRTKLIASNDYLLSNNPYFSFDKTSEDESLIIKCRPGLDAKKYHWQGPSNSDLDYKIDGEELHLFRSESLQAATFSCILKSDIELGSTVLELDINRDLFDRAFEKYHPLDEQETDRDNNSVEVNDQQSDLQEGGIANYECSPGEDC